MILGLMFLHPAMLYALPLCAIPILLHFLFRKRAVRRPWAAIELLRRAIDRTRRKRQLEEWVVLLLRCLAVAAIVLMVSRPLDGPGIGSDHLHRLLILDDSRSMEHETGGSTAFERGKQALRAEVEQAIERDRGERLTIVLTSNPDRPVVEDLSVGDEAAADLVRRIDALETTSRTTDRDALFTTLRAQIDRLGEQRIRIDWFTDLRARDWPDGVTDGIEQLLRDPEQRDVQLAIRRVDGDRRGSLGIQTTQATSRRLVAGEPLPIRTVVRNDGPTESAGGQMQLTLDGLLADPIDLPRVPAGEEVELQFVVEFEASGPHAIGLRLPTDGYHPDDRFVLALDLAEKVRVTIVDGQPDERPTRSESFLLRAALDPAGRSDGAVELRVVEPSRLAGWSLSDWSETDLLAFCDVAELPEQTAAGLETYVDQGGGVLLFTGDRTDPVALQLGFFDRALAHLGVEAVETVFDPDAPRAVELGESPPRIFAEDEALWRRIFAGLVRVGGHTRVELAESSNAEVILSLQNATRDPLWLRATSGDLGPAMVCTTSADGSWNNLGAHPALLAIAQTALETCVRRPRQTSRNFQGDEPITIDVDLGRYRSEVDLVETTDQTVLVAGTATPLPAAEIDPDVETGRQIGRFVTPAETLDRAGLFEARLRQHDGTVTSRFVARNEDPTEGHLETRTQETLEQRIDPGLANRFRIVPVKDAPAAVGAEASGRSWRLLGLLALLLVIAETAWTSKRGGAST